MKAVKGQILGKKLIEFTDSATGKLVRGVRYYIAYESDNTEGYETTSCYVSASMPILKVDDFVTAVIDTRNKRSTIVF